MKYLLLMYSAEGLWADEERRDCMVESLRVCDELTARGQFLATSPLQSVTTAATVRVRLGQALVTDGPFAETTEQLGGYFLLDLPDLDEAIAVAACLPTARKGTVEIRPLLALDGLPPARPFPAGTSVPGLSPFLLLCYHDEAAWREVSPDARHEAMTEAAALCRELSDAGRYLNSSPLHPWRRPRACGCAAATGRSPTGRSPRRAKSSGASMWSWPSRATTPSASPPGSPVPGTARSRCGRCSTWRACTLRCRVPEPVSIPGRPVRLMSGSGPGERVA